MKNKTSNTSKIKNLYSLILEKGSVSKKEEKTACSKNNENVREDEKEDDKQLKEKGVPSSSTVSSKVLQNDQKSSAKDDESAIEAIRRFMAEKLGLAEGKKESKIKVF